MKPDYAVCHYAEIGLKGKNRRFFEDRLKENIKEGLKTRCPGAHQFVKRIHNRILIKLTEKGEEFLDDIAEVLKNTFGIAYFAFVRESKQEMEALKDDCIEILSDLTFDSFRITARRGDHSIPLKTQQMNEVVGAHVLEHLGKKVNLGSPDLTCYIDLVQTYAFIYTQKIRSKGGLPVGVSGKVVAMVSGGIDSPVASYYAMKRGATVIFLHFHSVPYTTRASIEKVREIILVLNRFQLRARLFLVELAPIQEEIMMKTNAKLRVILYRRFMFRIAEMIAGNEGAHAIVTGESLGQVASQTLDNMEVIERVTKIPILRPLIGFDKQEIINLAKVIETYEISIQPDQDCCSLFVPKHPAIKGRIDDVTEAERVLEIEPLVQKAVQTAEVEVID